MPATLSKLDQVRDIAWGDPGIEALLDERDALLRRIAAAGLANEATALDALSLVLAGDLLNLGLDLGADLSAAVGSGR